MTRKLHDSDFFTSSGIPMCLCDTGGAIRLKNGPFRSMFGYGADAAKRRRTPARLADICLPDFTDSFREALAGAAKSGAAAPVQFRFMYGSRRNLNRTAEAHITRLPGSDTLLLSFIDVTDGVITMEELDRRNSDLTSLVKVTKLISSTFDPQKILNVAITEALRLFGMDCGHFLTVIPGSPGFNTAASVGAAPLEPAIAERVSRFFLESATERLKPAIIEEGEGHHLSSAEEYFLKAFGARVVSFTPEIHGGTPRGLLCMASTSGNVMLGSERMPLLMTLTHQMGVALENSRLFKELEDSRRRYWLLSEKMKDVVFTLDRNLTITYVNSAVTAATGYERGGLIGSHVSRLLTDNPLNEAGAEAIRKLISGEDVATQTFELRRADGTTEMADVSLAAMTEGSKLVWFQGIARIITAKLQMEREIRRRNEELNLLLDLSRILSSSPELKKLQAGGKSSHIASYPRGALRSILIAASAHIARSLNVEAVDIHLANPGLDLTRLISYRPSSTGLKGRKAARIPASDWLRSFLNTGEPIASSSLSGMLPGNRVISQLKRTGVRSIAAAPLVYGGRPLGVLSASTISRSKEFTPEEMDLLTAIGSQVSLAIMNSRYLEELSLHRTDLERLHSRLITIQEDDRKRIARELHDEAGQSLYVLRLNLDMIKSEIAKINPKISANVDEQLKIVTQTIDNIRRITYDLRPMLLDDLGLLPAIRWYVDSYEKRTGVKVELEMSVGKIALDSTAEVNLYRIIQEALTNVYRHAAASTVSISILESEGRLNIKIADNGRGFSSKSKAPQEGGVGLVGIRERISSLNGSLVVYSRQGRGTMLDIAIPLP